MEITQVFPVARRYPRLTQMTKNDTIKLSLFALSAFVGLFSFLSLFALDWFANTSLTGRIIAMVFIGLVLVAFDVYVFLYGTQKPISEHESFMKDKPTTTTT